MKRVKYPLRADIFSPNVGDLWGPFSEYVNVYSSMRNIVIYYSIRQAIIDNVLNGAYNEKN